MNSFIDDGTDSTQIILSYTNTIKKLTFPKLHDRLIANPTKILTFGAFGYIRHNQLCYSGYSCTDKKTQSKHFEFRHAHEADFGEAKLERLSGILEHELMYTCEHLVLRAYVLDLDNFETLHIPFEIVKKRIAAEFFDLHNPNAFKHFFQKALQGYNKELAGEPLIYVKGDEKRSCFGRLE